MINLAVWLEEHLDSLIATAVAELAQSDELRVQVMESVAYFYEALIQAAHLGSSTPLDVVLLDWVEARSAPTEEDSTALVSVLSKLKEVTWLHLHETPDPQLALTLLTQADVLYTGMLLYLSRLEADVLLRDMRRQLDEAHTHLAHLKKHKTDFVAVAAHELRTPLTVIEGYGDMLRGMGTQAGNEALQTLLEGLDGGVKRLRSIVRDMIDVSLINLEALELYLQPTWLPTVLRAVERRVYDAMNDRQVALIFDHDSMPTEPTYADSERLMQVLEKVILNGVKYTPDGGSVTVSARHLQGFTDVIVTDTGIGINPEDLPRIFDTFSSLGEVALHSSGKTKFKGGGPGLGLSIAKGIIEAHGGTIWAESLGYDEKRFPGTSFHIMIPMRAAP